MASLLLDQPAVAKHDSAGKIGPNAAIQTVNALVELYGSAATRALLEEIGKPWLIDYHPGALIDEREFPFETECRSWGGREGNRHGERSFVIATDRSILFVTVRQIETLS